MHPLSGSGSAKQSTVAQGGFWPVGAKRDTLLGMGIDLGVRNPVLPRRTSCTSRLQFGSTGGKWEILRSEYLERRQSLRNRRYDSCVEPDASLSSTGLASLPSKSTIRAVAAGRWRIEDADVGRFRHRMERSRSSGNDTAAEPAAVKASRRMRRFALDATVSPGRLLNGSVNWRRWNTGRVRLDRDHRAEF